MGGGRFGHGRLDLELPVSGLVPGVHRLMLRFADEAGRWTGIMTRNFVRLGPDYSSNTLRSYECWIDAIMPHGWKARPKEAWWNWSFPRRICPTGFIACHFVAGMRRGVGVRRSPVIL